MHAPKLFGWWSLIGTWIVLTALAVWAGQLGTAVDGILNFLSGNITTTAEEASTFSTMLGTVVAVVALELPFALVVGFLLKRLLGQISSHAIGTHFREMEDDKHFFYHFITIVLEESYARWLFLGFLTQFALFSGNTMFWILFLVGNGTWALVHLFNYEAHDRNILRVLPQFIGGVFYTYIFLEFGLLASILAHVMGNTILFASHKRQRIDLIDVLIIAYGVGCVLMSYHFMDKSPSDALVWLSSDTVFALPGWDFWDYLQFSVFISGILIVVLGLLFYDRGQAGKTEAVNPLTYIFLVPFVVILMWVLYWVLGFVIDDTPYRILTLALLFAFLQSTSSGSATSNVFWKGLPELYMTMCILLALGPIPALGWLMLDFLIGLPHTVLVALDD